MRPYLLATLAAFSCEWVADPLSFTTEEVPIYRAKATHPAPLENPTRLRVMEWNIKYGACRVDFWFDAWGDRVQLSQEEVDDCLAKVAALINEYQPDVFMTEEIEVDSRRSAYTDMVRYLLEHTDLTYAAYFQTWNSRYVPSEGVGRIDLGNAIFSRYPIKAAQRIRQEDRTDQSTLTKTFYIHRAVGRAELDVGRTVVAMVVHTEAYDQDETKQKQIAQIHALAIDELDAGRPFVLGGDFNELPPLCDERDGGCDGLMQLSGFPDEHPSSIGTMYEQPPYTPHVMRPFFDDFQPSIPLPRYAADAGSLFTHSVRGPNLVDDAGVGGTWNRTLDYLFIRSPDAGNESWENTDVIQGPGRLGVSSDPLWLSDHAPTAGTWVLP